MNSFKALIKREYWEHKGAIFYTPAVMAAIFAVLMLLGGISGDRFTFDNGEDIVFSEHFPEAMAQFESLTDEKRSKLVQMGLYVPTVLFGGVMFFICLFYALGSLYDERKDRSILFWKSLPISDTATVLSKFVAISILVPLSYFIVIAMFQLYLLVFFTVSAWFSGYTGVLFWTASNLFGVFFNSFFALIVASLWMAPLWGWFMFASSWAKKVAFLWAGLPILMLAVAEAWVLKSNEFIEAVGYRIANGFAIQNSNIHFLGGGDMFDLDVISPYEVFANGQFWIGILIAAVFLVASIYTRRYRNES